jgi:hypothetical protein
LPRFLKCTGISTICTGSANAKEIVETYQSKRGKGKRRG